MSDLIANYSQKETKLIQASSNIGRKPGVPQPYPNIPTGLKTTVKYWFNFDGIEKAVISIDVKITAKDDSNLISAQQQTDFDAELNVDESVTQALSSVKMIEIISIATKNAFESARKSSEAIDSIGQFKDAMENSEKIFTDVKPLKNSN